MTDRMFHMPIVRVQEFFADRTMDAINTFLYAGHVHNDMRLIALVTDYRIGWVDRENVTADARLFFIGEEEGGKLWSCDPRDFEDPELVRAYSALAAAWTTDDLAVQSVAWGILPGHRTRPLTDPAIGKLYRHVQTRNFALFGREYPAGAEADFGEKIRGDDADLEWRRYFMNILLPRAETAHEIVEETAHYAEIKDLGRRLYNHQMDGEEEELPLAPFDFDAAFSAE
jgi:hypothetical protein